MSSYESMSRRLKKVEETYEKSKQEKQATSDVAIKQITIEVKVMKIGNKQVTLAVFRQLQNEDIIDTKTGELAGIAWGRVNYHVDCDNFPLPHIHVVWQKGNELRRSIAFLPFSKRENLPVNVWRNTLTELEWAAYNFLIARTLEGWKPSAPRQLHQYVEIEDMLIHVEMDRDDDMYQAWLYGSVTSTNNMQKILSTNGFPSESALYHENVFLPLYTELKQITNQWQQSYAQLEQLDQLFIAV